MPPRARRLTALLICVLAGCAPSTKPVLSTTGTPSAASSPTAAPSPSPTPPARPPTSRLPGAAFALPALPPGVAFTGRLLIADRGNGRIIEINAAGVVDWYFPHRGQKLPVPFGAPDDAFYTANGATIIANSEGHQTVTAIDRATGTILWQVGRYNVRSSAVGYFNEPDDAVPQADGTIWVADIRNCRLVHLSAAGAWLGTLGNRVCRHHPPLSFAEPNGAFPSPGGSLIVTEIGGSWVTSLLQGRTVAWAVRTSVRYPSDAMQMPGGSVLLTDYSLPGAVVRLSSTGTTLWYYRPAGAAELNHTSIAIPLASNRVAICDDFHSRIVVVDPANDQVIWTFKGSGAFRLFYPDGIDYEPPQ
ncbi:MAG: PQQ-binding-like beta-propeller repeat protein [Candidatus Dormiibacterota bacterium]